jgi:hypothetical protein
MSLDASNLSTSISITPASHIPVMELDWRLFGSVVELQLDLDLDPLIITLA